MLLYSHSLVSGERNSNWSEVSAGTSAGVKSLSRLDLSNPLVRLTKLGYKLQSLNYYSTIKSKRGISVEFRIYFR